jgi:hypothetical protein
LSSRSWCRISSDFWYCGALSFIYAGAHVACAGVFSSSGTACGRASVRGTLLSPRVDVDFGGRIVLFRRRIILRRGRGLFWRRRRCRRRRGGVTGRRYVGMRCGRRFINVRAGTQAGGMFRRKRRPEREKTPS